MTKRRHHKPGTVSGLSGDHLGMIEPRRFVEAFGHDLAVSVRDQGSRVRIRRRITAGTELQSSQHQLAIEIFQAFTHYPWISRACSFRP